MSIFQSLTYQQWLELAEQTLSETADQNLFLDAKFDANLLLQTVTKRSKSAIFAFSETLLNEQELNQLAELLYRRANGEPMAYILGEKEFWSLNLKVSEHTLIPRPDTEILVEQALNIAQHKINTMGFSGSLDILDLGTGTGAIALALAAELAPLVVSKKIKLNIIGVDRIAEAVALAQENAKKLNLAVTFLQSNWFTKISANHRFDLIVSNPPYIDKQDPHLTQGDVRFEPQSALIANENGYADLRHIIEQAPQFLKNQGYLLLEHGWQQGKQVREIFLPSQWDKVQTIQDYAHNDRVTLGCLIWNT